MKQNVNMETGLTIRDVAKKAGVSPATVSRVLNGKYRPDNDTYLRIKDVLAKSRYTRKKQVKATGTILCLSRHDESLEGHGLQLEKTLEEHALRVGLRMIITRTKDKTAILNTIRDNETKGVVFIESPDTEELSVPAVVLNNYYTGRRYSSVDCDDMFGIVDAMVFLRKQGHRRIAVFIDVELKKEEFHPRKSLFPQIYKLAEVEYDEKLVWGKSFERDRHHAVIKEAAEYFTSLKEPPSAMITSGDIYVPVFYDCYKLLGYKIPEDISIIGFDDLQLASIISPPLTTIRKPLEKMTEECIRILLERFRDPNIPTERILVAPELIVRDSTAPRKGRHRV